MTGLERILVCVQEQQPHDMEALQHCLELLVEHLIEAEAPQSNDR
mgnify:CR=1 FL=1